MKGSLFFSFDDNINNSLISLHSANDYPQRLFIFLLGAAMLSRYRWLRHTVLTTLWQGFVGLIAVSSRLSHWRSLLLGALAKALLVCVAFWVLYSSQGHDWVRETVEDVAFDVINRLSLSIRSQTPESLLTAPRSTSSPTPSTLTHSTPTPVTVFAFDNAYLANHRLFDSPKRYATNEANIANYGYVFPRQDLALFLQRLDAQIKYYQTIPNAPFQCPKALFIDFDLRFTRDGLPLQLANPSPAQAGDVLLLRTLEQDRCYRILLAQNSPHHFIKDYATERLKTQIQQGKLSFVSPYFYASRNGSTVVRRYQPIKYIAGEPYPSAAIALWHIQQTGRIDTEAIAQMFQDDVNPHTTHQALAPPPNKQPTQVNRTLIWLKAYQYVPSLTQATNTTAQSSVACVQQSYWQSLKKYSLSCLDDPANTHQLIPFSFINNGLLFLGGTDRENTRYAPKSGDYHSVFAFPFAEPELMSGVDIHANTLMTLLHLQSTDPHQDRAPTLQSLSLFYALPLVFIVTFLVSLCVDYVLKRLDINYELKHISWIVLIILLPTTMLFGIFSYLLLIAKQPLWFNWLIPFILIELSEYLFLLIARTGQLRHTLIHRLMSLFRRNL